jgi:hypothetical protein
VVEPLTFVAVRVYISVVVGVTMKDPEEEATLPIPWSIATEEAFMIVQERVLETPGWISERDAVNEDTEG